MKNIKVSFFQSQLSLHSGELLSLFSRGGRENGPELMCNELRDCLVHSALKNCDSAESLHGRVINFCPGVQLIIVAFYRRQ